MNLNPLNFKASDVFSKNEKSSKNRKKNSVLVSVDTYHSVFDFVSIENGDKATMQHTTAPYTAALYSEAFMDELTKEATKYCDKIGDLSEYNVILAVPDSAVAMDTVNIPSMNRKRNEDAVEATVAGLFKESSGLKVNKTLAGQSKMLTTYSLTLMNGKLYDDFVNALTTGGMAPDTVTFFSAALGAGVSALSQKLKGGSYLFLDIKHHTSDFVFMAKGRASGYYSLPFGYSILGKRTVASEDMLFDHSVAELAVLNAREKAKAKQLTMMREETAEKTEDGEENLDAVFGADENATADPTELGAGKAQTIKSLPKKVPRKLPKFMLRPQPTDEQGYGYENFRIFVKWALNLLQSNEKLIVQGKPDAVYVNMPDEFSYIFDYVNAEKDQNGIEFLPLGLRGEKETVLSRLELFGGLNIDLYDRANCIE